MAGKGSGFAPNYTIKTPRNDTVPSMNRVNNPSTVGLPESSVDDPHYRGDNVRQLMQEEQPPYTSRDYKGSIDVGPDNNIWQYSDEQIRKTLKQRLGEKHGLLPEEFDVIVHRHTGRIEYDYKYQVMQARNPRFDKNAMFSELEKGTAFDFPDDMFKKLFKEEDIERFNLRQDDIWIKIDDTRSRLWKNKDIKIALTNPDKTIIFVEEDVELKEVLDKPEGFSFNELGEGEKFVFVIQPDVIKDSYDYDDVFIKVDKDTITGPDGQDIDIKDLGYVDVVKQDVWEKQYKYKKEGIDSAFSLVFSRYKSEKTKYGATATLPLAEFMGILNKYNVSESKFNDMTEEKDDVLTGHYIGRKEDYMWIIRGEEIEITKA